MRTDPKLLLRQIAERARTRREELGLRQHDVAERLGIADNNITRIENARQNLTIETVCKLADALEMDVEELLVGRAPERPR